MEINYALIGKRIRETRKQRGLSAEELAEIADLSTVYISYIENAKRKPSLESLIKISNALEITIDELLYGNLLYNPTEYQTDIDLLMADCTSTEKRYIFEVLSAIKNILRINDWHLSKAFLPARQSAIPLNKDPIRSIYHDLRNRIVL